MDQIVYVALQDDERIISFDLDESAGTLRPLGAVNVAGGPAPLALRPDGKVLYAGLRGRPGLAWLKRDPASGELAPAGDIPLDVDPCYLATDRAGRFLFSAYYKAGLVAVHALADDGSIDRKPVEWRPTAVNAHCFYTDPSNRFAFVSHTGPNLILQFRFDPQSGRLSPNEPASAAAPAGVGPRHYCFHPAGRLVLFSNELASSASSYAFDAAAGTLILLHTESTLPPGFSGPNTSAKIRVSPDGRFLYVSNRGHDSIATLAVDEYSGRLRFLSAVASEKVPRAFALGLRGRTLIAAGQSSGTLAVYAIGADGLPVRTAGLPAGRKPLWVLPAAVGKGPS